MGDLRRWNADGLDSFFDARDKCLPIAEAERLSNPNIG